MEVDLGYNNAYDDVADFGYYMLQVDELHNIKGQMLFNHRVAAFGVAYRQGEEHTSQLRIEGVAMGHLGEVRQKE